MLQLKNIVKDYPAGSGTVHALKGITLNFRRSEFVSILGPSGCGKTTMLNIIGGLDKYTSGDLIINGVSTKNYKDRDWDAYRNHSIGFVFQSYNLIPHQSVLANVELALTLSGVSKAERKRRAVKALEEVGLGDQLNKKPGEMSGGQMQRVAIARALVNNPDIILADEPTGALDTKTSKQVMEILKSISHERLIIMVTHNPELAEEYSSRIIKILDGVITDDSRPLTDEKYAEALKNEEELKASNISGFSGNGAKSAGKKEKKPSMSFRTAFGLSLKNLFTKRGRTILTSFAGSIGIIGIALILSVSQGTTAYIDDIQRETLTSYPIQIEKTTIDLSSVMSIFMGEAGDGEEHEDGAVYQKSAILSMLNAMENVETEENDLASFKTYLEEELAKEDAQDSGLSAAVSGVKYSYDLPLIVYTKDSEGNIVYSDTAELLSELLLEHTGVDYSTLATSGNTLMSSYSDMMSTNTDMWCEMLEGKDGSLISSAVTEQYDLIYGSWPNDYNEIVLVLDSNNDLDDLTLYAMGVISKEEVEDAIENGNDSEDEQSWSYEEMTGREFRVVLNSDCYTYDETLDTYTDLRETDAGIKYLYDNALTLKISGIIKPSPDSSAGMLSGSLAYTCALKEYVIEQSQKSDAIAKQTENPDTDIIENLPFKENTETLSDAQKSEAFKEYAETLSEEGKAAVYVEMMSIPAQTDVDAYVNTALSGVTREDMESVISQGLSEQMSMDEEQVEEYVADMTDDELNDLLSEILQEQYKTQYAQQIKTQLENIPATQKAAALEDALNGLSDTDGAIYHDEIMEFSDSTYEDNLLKLGYVDLDNPSEIDIYASTFESKDIIENYITAYNEGLDEISRIKYTDYVGLIMSSVTTIINAITYVLIAFVAISLIVSSIMIGVITLISVQERTKEIGILRSIGASKRNVSSMFNAETMIIGFSSGLFGVIITYLFCIPINLILHSVTGINTLNAYLPPIAAIALIIISMLLTLIAGIIPSRSAAKKDPVVALRTE